MIRIRFRRLVAIVILVVLITLATLSLTKELILRHWLEEAFEKHLNLQVRVQEIYISLFKPRLTFDGVYVSNPINYGRHWLANVSEVVIEYDLPALVRRSFRVKRMKLDILEINMVKDANGQINLNSISQLPANAKEHLNLSIETLSLSIRRVTYQDLTMAVPIKVYDLNLKNMLFQNVDTLEDLSRLIAVKILERIGVSQIGISQEDMKNIHQSPNPLLQAGSFVEDVIQSLREAIPG